LLWVITRVALLAATTLAISGSEKPLVSLMTDAPASMLRRATSALVVSTEITTSLR
jgi:hypothetical protein